MKHFIRVLLVMASSFMVAGNLHHGWEGLTASGLFLLANVMALIYNTPRRGTTKA